MALNFLKFNIYGVLGGIHLLLQKFPMVLGLGLGLELGYGWG